MRNERTDRSAALLHDPSMEEILSFEMHPHEEGLACSKRAGYPSHPCGLTLRVGFENGHLSGSLQRYGISGGFLTTGVALRTLEGRGALAFLNEDGF